MKTPIKRSPSLRHKKRGQRTTPGFTLLEVMVSLFILSIAMALLAGSFSNVNKARIINEEQLDSLHQGEFVMDLLEQALRSAAFLGGEKFGFIHEDEGDEDLISFVTGSPAFIHPNTKIKNGYRRVYLGMEDGVFSVKSHSYLIDYEEEAEFDREVQPWPLSDRVEEFNVEPYSVLENDFEDEWENERSIPQWVRVTVKYQPPPFLDQKQDAVELVRLIEMPVGVYARQQAQVAQDDQANAEAENDELEQLQQQEQGIQPGQGGQGGQGGGNTRTQQNNGFGNQGGAPIQGGGSFGPGR